MFYLFFMFSRSRNPFLAFLESCHSQETSKSQVNFLFCRCSRAYFWVLWICVISSFPTFSRLRIPFIALSEATMSGWPWKFRSTSGFACACRYLWMGLINSRIIFFIPHVLEIKESIFRSITKIPCPGDLKNSGKLPVLQMNGSYMDFSNFFTLQLNTQPQKRRRWRNCKNSYEPCNNQ